MHEAWSEIRALPRRRVDAIARREIPISSGVYVWFKDDEPVYVGRAAQLRGRISTHLGRTRDLSRSTLRRTVALQQRGIPRGLSRNRPTVVPAADVEAVNAWLLTCEIAWLELSGPDAASAYERAALAEWRPPMNLI